MFEKLRAMLAEQLGCDESRITESTVLLEDLECDSLALVEYAMVLEEEFSIEMNDEEVKKLKTFGDVVKYVEDLAE